MGNCKFVKAKSIFLAAALVWMLPAFAAAQAVTTGLTATEIFDPLNLMGNGSVGAFTNPGTLSCPGAQPTGNPMQPCPPGSRMNVRGSSWVSRVTSSNVLLTGWFYSDGNANYDSNATGQLWGTFRIELDAGGAWEGNWTGDRSKVGEVWLMRVRGVGRGSGGMVDGVHLRFTEIAPMPNFLAIVWLGSIDAEILAPPSP
jgi:hypothetical protein